MLGPHLPRSSLATTNLASTLQRVLHPVETTVGLQVAWPLEVVSSTPLGAIRDASGNSYPRDIGRSSELGGSVFFQFGDTFCHNSDGDFIDLTNNTAALLLDKSNPTLTKYAGSTQERIPDFIKLLNDEQNGSGLGHSIWSFSGTVEYQKQGHHVDGWTWYQMRIRYPHDLPTDEPKVAYIGIARVSYHTRHRTLTTLRDKEIPVLFEDDPQLGDFCAVGDSEYIYVYGRKNTDSTDIVLGRVKASDAHSKMKYQYWTHSGWTPSVLFPYLGAGLRPIFTDMVHGQVFKTTMFGPESRYEWAFIGCNKFIDSKVLMGRSEKPEGPWDVHELTEAYTSGPNDYPNRYCMYVHPWASDEGRGDICVSWSEGGMQGRVLMAMLRLKTEPTPLEE